MHSYKRLRSCNFINKQLGRNRRDGKFWARPRYEDDLSLVTSVGQKKPLSPHEESSLRPSDSALRYSTTESQRLHGERSLLRSKFWFWSCDERGTRKTSESPWGIEPQTFGFCSPMLYDWTKETPWWVKSLSKFIWYASCILWGLAMSIG